MSKVHKTAPKTIIESVAFETQKFQFRGSVLGQQGKYLDKVALRSEAADFCLADFVEQAEKLRAYVEANGAVKF